MFTLANNVATFVVDRTGVTGSSGVYTINYDSDLFDSTKKLLDNGYTVVFKVVLKNVTTKKDTDFRYFQAIHNNVSTKIYFLPDAELSNEGVFKFTLLDIPDQVKTNKTDIVNIKSDIEDIKEDIQDAEGNYTHIEQRMGEVETEVETALDKLKTLSYKRFDGFWKGQTLELTLTPSTHALLIGVSPNTNAANLVTLSVNSSGLVANYLFKESSYLTFTPSTNKLDIANSGTAMSYWHALIFTGSIDGEVTGTPVDPI